MNALARRVARLEKRDSAKQSDGCTWEEFCRRLWRDDPQRYREESRAPQNWMQRHWISQFEAEDVARCSR